MIVLGIIAALTAAYAIHSLLLDAREARRRNDRLAARLARAESRARRAVEHADEAQTCLDMMLDLTRDEAKKRHPSARHLSVVSS